MTGVVQQPTTLPDVSHFAPPPAAGAYGAPVPPPLAPAALTYAAPRGYAWSLPVERVGQSGFGIASLSLFGVTLVFTVVCAAGLSRAKEWEALAWLVVGFAGNWLGAGMGMALGFVGVLQTRRRRRLSAYAMSLNAAVAVAPFAIIWVMSLLAG